MAPPRLSASPFGPHTLLRLGTDRDYVSVVPACAAYVHQLCLGGRALLWSYPDGDALTVNKGHRNLALLPFPNRLLEGEYAWDGRELAFAVNNPATHSALHGFGTDAPFAVTRVDLGRDYAEVTLAYLHAPAERPGAYPFAVRFTCRLRVDTAGAGGATWTLSAENVGHAPAPIGLGWHPYFLMPGGPSAWTVAMPPNAHVVLRDAIPTGEREEGLPSDRAVPVDTDWDDCFALTEPGRRGVVLRGPDYALSLKQTGDARYTQVFVPPTQEAIAVEPMTCGVDAFRQNPAEVRVEPGGRVSVGMSVGLFA